MKRLFIFVFGLIAWGAQASPHDRPRWYSSCVLEYTGDSYYLARNHTRFTEFFANIEQALDEQQRLQHSGLCEWTAQSPGLCRVGYTGTDYYVARGEWRMGDFFSNLEEALRLQNLLVDSRNCEDSRDVQPSGVCDIQYTGDYWYVTLNGKRIADFHSEYIPAVLERDDLISRGMCSPQSRYSRCGIRYTGTYYYVNRDDQRYTPFYTNLDAAGTMIWRLEDDRICTDQEPALPCSVEYTGTYYYVRRESERYSEFFSDYVHATDELRHLQNFNVCY